MSALFLLFPSLSLLLLLLSPLCCAWQTLVQLSSSATLAWTSDVDKGIIMLEIVVKTDGWVGLGISPSGTMAGADLVIGWIAGDGKPHFKDYWAAENGQPTIDGHQNWQLHTARRNGSHTMLRVRRRLYTGDPQDAYILGRPTHVIYAWRDTPIGTGDVPGYHGKERRGTALLCLLHSDCFPRSTGSTNDVTARGAAMVTAAMVVVMRVAWWCW